MCKEFVDHRCLQWSDMQFASWNKRIQWKQAFLNFFFLQPKLFIQKVASMKRVMHAIQDLGFARKKILILAICKN